MIALAALTAILQDHDPAHIAWVGDDEYDIESTVILELLADTMEAPEVAALVHDVFVRMFDDTLAPAANDAMWMEIAGEMMEDGCHASDRHPQPAP